MKTEILVILLCHLIGKSVSFFFLNFPQIVIVIKQQKRKNKTHADVQKIIYHYFSYFCIIYEKLTGAQIYFGENR